MGLSLRTGKRYEEGFAYVAALIAIAIFGIGLANVGQLASAESRREKEQYLIRDALQVVAAIRSYYYASPTAVRLLPKGWDDLLEDKRFVGLRRHLRRIPLDPIRATTDWGEIRDPDGSFVGVYSKSTDVPFRTQEITFGRQRIEPGVRYSDWRFRFEADPEMK